MADALVMNRLWVRFPQAARVKPQLRGYELGLSRVRWEVAWDRSWDNVGAAG